MFFDCGSEWSGDQVTAVFSLELTPRRGLGHLPIKEKFVHVLANKRGVCIYSGQSEKKSLYMFKKVDQLNSSLNHQVSHRNNRNRLF